MSGDMVADIQRRREEREARERGEEVQKQREEAKRVETMHSAEEGVAKKCARTEKNDTEMDTEAGTPQSHSRHKIGHMTNILLIDSYEEAIVDFEKDHEELYDKTNEHFKDKARTKCL